MQQATASDKYFLIIVNDPPVILKICDPLPKEWPNDDAEVLPPTAHSQELFDVVEDNSVDGEQLKLTS